MKSFPSSFNRGGNSQRFTGKHEAMAQLDPNGEVKGLEKIRAKNLNYSTAVKQVLFNQVDTSHFDRYINFTKEINMVALPLEKEKAGYLLNSMLIPFLFSALDLYVNKISDPKSIDKAWILGTGAKEGPFQILDVIGLKTAYEIVSMYAKIPSILAPYNFKDMKKLLKK